jgi:hypothetical protein
MAERWTKANGWVQQSMPSPGGEQIQFTPQALACATTSSCLAVGTAYDESTGVSNPFSEIWNGSNWALNSAPPYSPASSNNGQGYTLAVSCFSASMCMVVGGNHALPFSATWNGSAWTAHSTPAAFGGVSCPTATVCEAVGGYSNGSPQAIAQAGVWKGSKWVLQTAPKLTNGTDLDEQSVSCPSTSFCEAVGGYDDGDGDNFTFAMEWNGKAWKSQTTPNPAGAGAGSGSVSTLSGVSCVSDTLCEATGEYNSHTTSYALNFAALWNGSGWTKERMPTPANSIGSFVQSVSCPSSQLCLGAGENSYYNSSNAVVGAPEAQIWNGHAWKLMTA